MYYQDGMKYENENDIPDIGGFECVKVEPNNLRTYYGKSAGVENFLANVNYAGNGSTALCVDTGDYYIFFNYEWYKQ